MHPAPRTFPHQGWIAANGLVVGAPGLPEAEVTPAGEILVTLVRSVGALARIELRTRPLPAGPEMMAPGAQTQGRVAATVTLARSAGRRARRRDRPVRRARRRRSPLLAAGASLLELDARRCVLSACKPAQDGDGVVVRVLNPTDESEPARLRFGLDVRRAQPVGLDEQPVEHLVTHHGREVELPVPPHALRSVRVSFG